VDPSWFHRAYCKFHNNFVYSIVKYTVKVYTPDAHARRDYELTVRIKGQGELKTADYVMHETTQVTEKYVPPYSGSGGNICM